MPIFVNTLKLNFPIYRNEYNGKQPITSIYFGLQQIRFKLIMFELEMVRLL